jgi:hypothetical protein
VHWRRNIAPAAPSVAGSAQNPISECLNGRVGHAFGADHELTVIGAQFRSCDRADEPARGDISFDQRHRSHGDTESVDGSRKLKVDMIELEMMNRQQA